MYFFVPLILRLLHTAHLIQFHIILRHLSAHIGIKLLRILFVLFTADFPQEILLEHPQGIFAIAADLAVAGILRDFVGKELRRKRAVVGVNECAVVQGEEVSEGHREDGVLLGHVLISIYLVENNRQSRHLLSHVIARVVQFDPRLQTDFPARIIFRNVLIGLMQLGARCSDGSCQAQEDLIAGFSAIEAEAELVQIGLKLCTATVICAEQKRFQVADDFV